jgi:hypothetical protein
MIGDMFNHDLKQRVDALCSELTAPLLPDEGGLESHDAFMARLRREHPRKSGFWSLLDPAL